MLSPLSEDCFRQPPGEEVWVLLCGSDEGCWRIIGPFWNWDMLEVQLERSRFGCDHPHAYRKATLDDLAEVDVWPSWIPLPFYSEIQDRDRERDTYHRYISQHFPERF